ncbi:hypothetical protein MRB53_014965 [Persea americana]|uniref:Uncharacterized protein n=1 Tax=Persea americana TaxID=3435 RepID=A0ACC2KCU5_PERAE|nr:hypothetical protein MRB53_014965 [Persea americana]
MVVGDCVWAAVVLGKSGRPLLAVARGSLAAANSGRERPTGRSSLFSFPSRALQCVLLRTLPCPAALAKPLPEPACARADTGALSLPPSLSLSSGLSVSFNAAKDSFSLSAAAARSPSPNPQREERDEIKVDDMSKTVPMIVMLSNIACGLALEYTSCETEGAGGSNPRSGADEEALRYFEILDDAQT